MQLFRIILKRLFVIFCFCQAFIYGFSSLYPNIVHTRLCAMFNTLGFILSYSMQSN